MVLVLKQATVISVVRSQGDGFRREMRVAAEGNMMGAPGQGQALGPGLGAGYDVCSVCENASHFILILYAEVHMYVYTFSSVFLNDFFYFNRL